MAWIRTLSGEEATGELADLYRRITARDGTVDNILSVHSLHPRSLADHLGLYRTLMYGPGPLTRRERELVAVAVSAANQCHYWVAHHGAGLRRLVRDDDGWIEALERDPDSAPLPPRERAMVDWALRLTRRPASMSREYLAPLRDAGLDDRAILDLAMIVAYYAYVNRLADGLGVELEPDRRNRIGP